MLDILRNRGSIILSDTSAIGGFDAVVMYGSLTAGVFDARGAKDMSFSYQKELLQRSIGMGFSSLIILHEGKVFSTLNSVLYWDGLIGKKTIKIFENKEDNYNFYNLKKIN